MLNVPFTSIRDNNCVVTEEGFRYHGLIRNPPDFNIELETTESTWQLVHEAMLGTGVQDVLA